MSRIPPLDHPGFTAKEVIAALSRLEPRLTAHARAEGRPLLTLRQLRYLDSRAVGCLQPDRVIGSPRGRRLYRVADVVLLRLALRVGAERSDWQAWSALAYVGDELRAAIATGERVALVFEGARASVQPLTTGSADAYPLPSCMDGVAAALRHARGGAAEIWNGWQWVRPTALVAGRGSGRMDTDGSRG